MILDHIFYLLQEPSILAINRKCDPKSRFDFQFIDRKNVSKEIKKFFLYLTMALITESSIFSEIGSPGLNCGILRF